MTTFTLLNLKSMRVITSKCWVSYDDAYLMLFTSLTKCDARHSDILSVSVCVCGRSDPCHIEGIDDLSDALRVLGRRTELEQLASDVG